jgi:hypothetical protein
MRGSKCRFALCRLSATSIGQPGSTLPNRLGCEEIQQLSSADPLAEDPSPPSVRSVGVKNMIFGNDKVSLERLMLRAMRTEAETRRVHWLARQHGFQEPASPRVAGLADPAGSHSAL